MKRRKYASLQIIILLLLAACESGTAPEEPGNGTLPPESAPLTNIALTRGAGDPWESIANDSYFHLYVKDATGTEKHALYTYTDGQWTPDETDEILCGNQATYPAYAYGMMFVTYATGNTDVLPVAWHGNLPTTVQPAEGTATATLPLNILTARIHVTVIGIYGETPAELPDFSIQSSTRQHYRLSIPADPYTEAIILDTNTDLSVPWPLSYNGGYSPGTIPPQSIAAGSTFLTISAPDDTDPVYGTTQFTVIAPNDIVLEAGKEYHYTIRLKGDGAQAEIVTEPTIAPFIPGSETNIRSYRGILTEADLRQFSTDWNADPAAALAKWEDTPGSGIIRLLGDIEMTGAEGFTPIGIYLNYFDAVFDGGGHTITGLHIDAGTGDDAALFTRNYGVIRGLHLRGAEIKGNNIIAGLVAYNGGTIAACSFAGTVTATENIAGSIAADNYATIAACYSVATEVSAPNFAGGIAGWNNSTGTLTACHWLTDSGQPAEAAGRNDGTATDCHAIATPAQLYNNPQYVSLMNAALDALPDWQRPPYRWVQIPGGEPVLLPAP